MHTTTTPDLAWLSRLAARRASLWLGRSISWEAPDQTRLLQAALSQGWRSVFMDGAVLPEAVSQGIDNLRIAPLEYRVVRDDPLAIRLAPNRIPVFELPIATGIKSSLLRGKMCEQLSEVPLVFAILGKPDDAIALREALEVADGVSELVVICPTASPIECAVPRFVYWQVTLAEFVDFLGRTAAPSEDHRRAATIALDFGTGVAPVDMTPAIDPSASVLDRFEMVPSVATLGEATPSPELLGTLLASPTASWLPYAAGIPLPRTAPYERALKQVLRELNQRGPEATCTCWIEAEQASGATTLLRTLAFNLARTGIPVLVARPNCFGFDFQQLLAFAKASAALIEKQGGRRGELPLVILFDADHVARNTDFVAGVANGLRKAGQIAVVTAIRPVLASVPRSNWITSGPSRTLAPSLANNVTPEQARELGDHVSRFLPPFQRRTPADWSEFLRQSTQITREGRQSLFWVALRFWLHRFPGSEQPLRQWLAAKIVTATCDSDEALTGLAEIACMSAHRLSMPALLLDAPVRDAVTKLLDDPTQPFGLRRLSAPGFSQFVIAHPMIAEEILRICAGDSAIISRIGVHQCSGMFDLQLALFERLIGRSAAGDQRVLPVIEELVTGALRVDPRENPRNFLAREQIVRLLEGAPDAVFESSQLFLHQLAKARRHLASEPPQSEYWSEPANVREQLELAEEHLLAAMTDGFPVDDERRDSPLNLHVTLALTYDLRSRFETDLGHAQVAAGYLQRAQSEYGKAQRLDPDNTYVLENFARFKLREARQDSSSPAGIRLAVEAISLLEWELEIDGEGRRRDAILTALLDGYSMLQSGGGLTQLTRLAEHGDEAAVIALARLAAFPSRFVAAEDIKPDIEAAVDRLRRVPPANVTWRSRALLYHLISEATPNDFVSRVHAADELAAMDDFPWPLQLKLEYGVLLYQVGERAKGAALFAELRAMMLERSGALSVPSELRFLGDPKAEYRQPLRTSIRVVDAQSTGRDFWGIPHGWGATKVPFKPYLFARDRISPRDDLDCLIQFSQYGPRAVPPTER